MPTERKPVDIKVPAKDPEEKKDEKDEKPDNLFETSQDAKKKNKVQLQQKEEELSEEDKKLKEELDMVVERVVNELDEEIQRNALLHLTKEIKTSTASMTSVPKPLKFLRPHYDKLKERYTTIQATNKKLLADVLSVLAMTMSAPGSRECLKFKLEGTHEEVGSWGHEYVKYISGEIGDEYSQRKADEKAVDELFLLVDQIVPFNMAHNAEPEACDLLMEVEKMEKLLPHVDENNYSRVCLYLVACASYVPEPEDAQVLRVALEVYKKMKQWPEALRLALKIHDTETAKGIFALADDAAMKKQLGFILGRHRTSLGDDVEEGYADQINNAQLSEYFLSLGQDLGITEAKTPEDIYKSNNETRGFSTAANVDSARQNLASTFVNAFVNAAFGQDKLMTEEGNKWLYKNKEHGMMSAAASLGMILMWDVDNGLSQIDKFLYANEDYVKAGALLAIGIVSANVKNDYDPALTLLSEYIENQSSTMRIGAIFGLGLAYAGSARQDLADLLLPVVEDTNASMEVVAMAGLALGLVFVGSANSQITESICQTLMERDEASLNISNARFLCLGLGLLYLGRQEIAEVTMETLKALTHPIGKYASVTVDTCAYAGTGNVLKVQKLLDVCGDHLEDKNVGHQGVAVLGIALIAMSEEIGIEMAIRSFDHLLQYGEPVIRRAVPLALGLLSVSNPRVGVMDTLSKLSHDSDEEVALSAILGMGLIGAGTNNSRVGNLLRSLATYYYKEPNHLFVVRVAQGLVYMGKGTISLSPFHSDRGLLSIVALSGLLTVLHASLDTKNIILGKHHYMLYAISTAMFPRVLMTFDENLKPLPVSVRVGQAVDTIGQAGRPKTITGFQTHTTPVLLSYGDRAELATEDYIPVSSVLEGFVILKPNPNAPPKEEETKKK